MNLNEIIQGDSLEVLKGFPSNSIDTIITDPPAGINFMAKSWDSDKGGRDKWIEWFGEIMKECYRVAKPGATALVWALPRTSHWTALGIEAGGWKIKDCIYHMFGSGFPKAHDIGKDVKEFEGWKSHGLKPAVECWWVAVKKNEGTYAQNALKWGVSGLNIDGGRIGKTTEIHSNGKRSMYGGNSLLKSKTHNEKTEVRNYGRFPANILLDEEAAKMLDEQSGVSKEGFLPDNKPNSPSNRGDKGGASRFFYVAKSSKRERNLGCEELPNGNNHPTVKSLKLCEYLCELTKTPTGGIVLDPFCGSGSIPVAAKNTGRDYIGIEKDPEYVKIAEARLKTVPEKLF